MAYVSSYEYDIFISYAHDDNASGWVDSFYEYLKKTLITVFGKKQPINIWIDSSLDGNQMFNEAICNTLEKSALFISLMSKNYLESDYCKKELDWFCEHVHKKGENLCHGQSHHRIIHGLLVNIPPDDWPDALKGKAGFCFYDENFCESSGLSLDLEDVRFRNVFRKLIDGIYKTLTAMKKNENNDLFKQAEPDKKSTLNNESSHNTEREFSKIFLASTSETLDKYIKRTRKELNKKGIPFFDPVPPPYDAENHEKDARKYISESSLCVHLIGEYPGKEIDDDSTGQTYPLKQLAIADEAKKDQLIWIPKSIDYDDIDDIAYRDHLKKLENDSRVIRTQPLDIPKIIIQRFEAINTQKIKSDSVTSKPSILVDTHIKDLYLAASLNNHLIQHELFSQFCPWDNTSDPLQQFEKCLSQTNILVIVYGQVDEKWVMERLSDATKLILIKKYPVHKRFVFVVPPKKKTSDLKERLDCFLTGIQMVDNSDSEKILPQNLSKIINATQTGGPS
ncbi:hypothetical protein MHK_010295 [Candidatus Magnetomorum sp. HK-1]|nr:hypothetical protein MHK_010295 [Candidatus Magnetomorum sp. HK-1]